MLNLFIWLRNCILPRSKKYGNFCVKTLKIRTILTFSNQMLIFGSLRIVHSVCAKFILPSRDGTENCVKNYIYLFFSDVFRGYGKRPLA